jgi:hypothetical protein
LRRHAVAAQDEERLSKMRIDFTFNDDGRHVGCGRFSTSLYAAH